MLLWSVTAYFFEVPSGASQQWFVFLYLLEPSFQVRDQKNFFFFFENWVKIHLAIFFST